MNNSSLSNDQPSAEHHQKMKEILTQLNWLIKKESERLDDLYRQIEQLSMEASMTNKLLWSLQKQLTDLTRD